MRLNVCDETSRSCEEVLVDSGVLPPDIDKVPAVLVPRIVALLMVRGLRRTVVVRAKAEIHGRSKLACPGSPESAQAHAELRDRALATLGGAFRRFPEDTPGNAAPNPVASEIVADMLDHLPRWASSAVESLPDDRRDHELLRLAFVSDFFGQGSWSASLPQTRLNNSRREPSSEIDRRHLVVRRPSWWHRPPLVYHLFC